MKTLNKLFVSAMMLLAAVPTFAQEDAEKKSEFNLNGEIRPRVEMKNGYKSPALKDLQAKTSVSQRTRINLKYKTGKIQSKIVLQDVRAWGDESQIYLKGENNHNYMHEAWAQINIIESLAVKAGRMEVVYDDHRIFGSVGWAQQARSHDLVMLKYDGVIKADAGFAFHNNSYQGVDAYRDMQFVHLSGKAMENNLQYSVLFLNNGIAKTEIDSTGVGNGGNMKQVDQKSVYSMTVGPNVKYKIGKDITISANFYYQMGELSGGDWFTGSTESKNTTLGAYEFAINAMYKVNKNIKVGLGAEQLSGNSYDDAGVPTSTTNKAFTPFYGTNHKFNGWMDYFYVGNHGNNVGLTDVNLKLIYKRGPFFVKLIPHYFMAAGKSKYSDKDGNAQDLSYLGTEIDLWAGYHFIPKVASIQFGYSQMLATDGMYALKGIDVSADREASNWAWAMLVLKPKFMNYTK